MGAIITPMRHNRGRLLPVPVRPPGPRSAGPTGGRPQKTERPHPRQAGGHLIHHHVTGPGTTSPRA